MNIFQCINEIEQKYPVATWKVGDVNVWPFVRIGLFEENDSVKSVCKTGAINKFYAIINIIRKIISLLYVIIIDNKHNEVIHKADALFWGFNDDRTITLSTGEKACQNLDMIKLELQQGGYSIYSLEYLAGGQWKFPRYTKSNLVVNWRMFKERFYSVFTKGCVDCHLPELDMVKDYLLQNGYTASNCEEKVIKKIANNIIGNAKIFSEFFDYTQPKIGVVVCWYSDKSMAFLYECHRRGIPCVDIQHGVAGGCNHRAYTSWVNVPEHGFNTMPTNFWCWTDKDASVVNEWYVPASNKIKRAFIGGMNTQAYLIQNDKNNRWSKQLNHIVQEGKIKILLSLQTGIVLPEWLVCYIKDTSSKIQWFIRKHPVMDEVQQEFIDKVKRYENVEYEVSSNCPLVTLLGLCQLHITSHSSVVLDAEPFAIKSVLLNEGGVKYFKESIYKGNCFFAQDDIALNEIIEREVGCYNRNKNVSHIGEKISGVDNLIKLIKH